MEKLFSADGIRGKTDYGILAPESLERLGNVLSVWWRELSTAPEILIGSDTRESSERIKQHLVTGLTRGGVRVVDAGVITTPAVSFLILHTGNFCGGISISGSHLPAIENGVKVFDESGGKIDDATEQYLEGLFFSKLPSRFVSRPASARKMSQLADAYITELIAEYPSLKMEKNLQLITQMAQHQPSGDEPLLRWD